MTTATPTPAPPPPVTPGTSHGSFAGSRQMILVWVIIFLVLVAAAVTTAVLLQSDSTAPASGVEDGVSGVSGEVSPDYGSANSVEHTLQSGAG
jgi:hypothetical protein